jgi:hypothetical protein
MLQSQPIYLPLQGPSGVRPKAPAVGAWQSPGYQGALPNDDGTFDQDEWVGMRCDGLVVIDCDCRCEKINGEKPAVCTTEAVARTHLRFWLRHAGHLMSKTWLRKTPHGYHVIYEQHESLVPDAPASGVWPGIDIRAGRTSQIVFRAPGYVDLAKPAAPLVFEPRWLPENYSAQQYDRSDDESWDEMPHGRGNNTMTAFAGAFRKQGMSPVTMAKCLGAINKITMTESPMPREEIAQIVMSVARYDARPDIDIEVEA